MMLLKGMLLSFSLVDVFAILVKNWGTGSQINRLAYTTYDVFNQAFGLMTAAQTDFYPIEVFNLSYPQVTIKIIIRN